MEFTKPVSYTEAIEKIGRKSIVGSKLSSSEWRDVPVALRERAFMSARVESAQFLQRARDGISEFLSEARETVETERGPEQALSTGSRQDFVKQMTDFLKENGIERTTGDIKDIAGERRLNLIFDTQVRQAHDYGYAKQGWDPDVLDAFPAQRFIRVAPVEEPRDWHIQFEGEVRLKSDVGFWTAINQDFGVPWGPWGWGCQHDVEDVDRAEAEALGLLPPGATVPSPEATFNDRLEASTKHLDPDIAEFLERGLGEKVEVTEESVKWRET